LLTYFLLQKLQHNVTASEKAREQLNGKLEKKTAELETLRKQLATALERIAELEKRPAPPPATLEKVVVKEVVVYKDPPPSPPKEDRPTLPETLRPVSASTKARTLKWVSPLYLDGPHAEERRAKLEKRSFTWTGKDGLAALSTKREHPVQT
jgi:HD superfamily phosphohydrolase